MRNCGFHVQQTSPELRAAILQVYPTLCVSLAHDRDFWREVKRDCPQTLLIGRLYEIRRGFSPDWRQVDPRRWAEECAQQEMCYDAWITRNEPHGINNEVTADDAKRYDEWCCVFRERGLELGFEAVGPNVAAGNWHGDAVVRYMPNLCQQFKYIGVHEYSARAMWDQAPGLERAPEDVPKDDGAQRGWWYTLRYRGWHRAICERYPWREGEFEMVISEGGVAYGVIPDAQGRPKYGDVGWQTDLSEQQYFESLDWYTRRLNEDDYVVGWAIFMVGHADPKWASFETLPVWRRLMEIPEVGAEPPPEPEPEEKVLKIYDFEHGPGDDETRDWEWLRGVFGDVQVHPIEDLVDLEPNTVIYRLRYLDARVGDTSLIINVKDLDGQPVERESVIFGWPDAPLHGMAGKPSNWTEHGEPQHTNVNGDAGPGMGRGAYYDPKKGPGPHFVWIWDLPSDRVTGLGMLPGGEPEPGVKGPHAHLNLGYEAVIYQGGQPGPGPGPEPGPEPEAGEALDIVAELEQGLGRLKAILHQIDDLV